MSSRKNPKNAWPDHLSARLKTLRNRMEGHKFEAFLVTRPHDICYLTGFGGEDSWAVVTAGGVTILSDRRFEEELVDHIAYARAVMRKKSLAEELAKIVRRHKIARMGVQGEHLTLEQRKAIVAHTPAGRLKPTAGWVMQQRAVKDAYEIALTRKAVTIQEKAFKKTLRRIKPGMTEKQISAMLEYEMKSLGADRPAFDTIVGSGANSSIPHYRPGEVRLKPRSPLLIDFGAVYNAYHSDMTRVVSFGKPPAKVAEIYNIVREAQIAGIAAIRPGVPLKEVDAAARKVITKAGYGKRFGHSLGHGIGLEIHEEPRLAKTSQGVLKAGHVVTVEPGIYLPGVGGVRLEDDILVTEKGHENLCTLPTDMESAII